MTKEDKDKKKKSGGTPKRTTEADTPTNTDNTDTNRTDTAVTPTNTDNNDESRKQTKIKADSIALLNSIHAIKEFTVELSKSVFINAEVTLSSNLQVLTIKSTSDAIHALLIDDQILSVNGKVANNAENVMDMVRESISDQVEIAVNRQANKAAAPPLRFALHDGEEPFRRLNGAQYFVVKLVKVPKVHLGFRVKSFRRKIIITDVQEHGVAFFSYNVGDYILDLNGVQMNEVDVFQKKMRESMNKYGSCTTLIERPTSMTEIDNAKVLIDVLAKSKIDPPLGRDAIAIGHREAQRYMANVKKQRKLKSCLHKKKKKSKKRHSLINVKHTEEKIGTDVPNPSFLHKLPKHKVPANSMTFLPKFLQ